MNGAEMPKLSTIKGEAKNAIHPSMSFDHVGIEETATARGRLTVTNWETKKLAVWNE